MEDLIILALFVLASLASYISKLRESKRRRKTEAEEGQYPTEGFEWPDVSVEPEFKPMAQGPPPPSKSQREQPYSDRSPEPQKGAELQQPFQLNNSEISRIEHVPPVHQPLSDGYVAESVPVPAYKAKVGYVERKFGNYEFSSTSRLKIKNYVRINVKSKLSFQRAILAREILDRPRAFDI